LGGLLLVVGDLRVAVHMPPPPDHFLPDVIYEVVEGCSCDGSISPSLD
jgi:hypothetical protein